MPTEDAEGGRGLPLAHAIVNAIEMTRTNDGNRWRMVRKLANVR